MWTENIHDELFLVFYNVQLKNPGILKFLFPVKEDRDRKRLVVQETRGMFMRHKSKAAWAIESVQETFLREKGEAKIKVLSKEETEEILKRKTAIFQGWI